MIRFFCTDPSTFRSWAGVELTPARERNLDESLYSEYNDFATLGKRISPATATWNDFHSQFLYSNEYFLRHHSLSYLLSNMCLWILDFFFLHCLKFKLLLISIQLRSRSCMQRHRVLLVAFGKCADVELLVEITWQEWRIFDKWLILLRVCRSCTRQVYMFGVIYRVVHIPWWWWLQLCSFVLKSRIRVAINIQITWLYTGRRRRCRQFFLSWIVVHVFLFSQKERQSKKTDWKIKSKDGCVTITSKRKCCYGCKNQNVLDLM